MSFLSFPLNQLSSNYQVRLPLTCGKVYTKESPSLVNLSLENKKRRLFLFHQNTSLFSLAYESQLG